jgi:NTP pyrophosphatase (non-canonical NTP hydrolase)
MGRSYKAQFWFLAKERADLIARIEAEGLQAVFEGIPMSKVLEDIVKERVKQDLKWGEQNHNPYKWTAIIMEELGECSEAVSQTEFGGPKGGLENIRKEAIHTAATALAFVECLDRKKYPENWG